MEFPPPPPRSQNLRAARPEMSLGQSNQGLRGGACQLAPALKVIEALVLRIVNKMLTTPCFQVASF